MKEFTIDGVYDGRDALGRPLPPPVRNPRTWRR